MLAPTAAAAAAALIKVVTAVQRLVFVHCSQRVAPRAKASEQSYANIFSYCCEHINAMPLLAIYAVARRSCSHIPSLSDYVVPWL